MTDDAQYSTASLVELSKLLHTHDWPGDISLLIGSFLDETVLRVELYEFVPLLVTRKWSSANPSSRSSPGLAFVCIRDTMFLIYVAGRACTGGAAIFRS